MTIPSVRLMSSFRPVKLKRTAEAAARQFGTSALDNRVSVATPENIAVKYAVAGPFTRLLAFLLDMVILGLLIGVVGLVLLITSASLAGFFGEASLHIAIGLLMLFVFLVSWLYGTLSEAIYGRTIGKLICGLRVLTTEGRPINIAQAVIRNFLRLADTMPLVPLSAVVGGGNWALTVPSMGVGLLVMACNQRFQRLGDLAAGTMVVVEHRKWQPPISSFADPRVSQLAEYIPASFQVSNELASTLSLYVQRRESFSAQRIEEIARHVGVPLLVEFGLPSDTNHDLLLCALYDRTFLAGESRGEREWRPPQIEMPPSTPHYTQAAGSASKLGDPVPDSSDPTPAASTGSQSFGTPPPGYGPGR